jgi:hypothetical protein
MEVSGLPGYSLEGDGAGRASNIAFATPAHVVECQVTASFYHRIPLLHPDLKALGVGYVRSAPCPRCDCSRIAVLGMSIGGPEKEPKSAGATVVFPPDGATDVPRRYGVEWPNPIEDAPKDAEGLSVGGVPITVSFFGYKKIELLAADLMAEDGTAVPCWVSSPAKPARKDFPQDETICIMAKEILEKNSLYKVTVKAKIDGADWSRTWSFKTGERLLPEGD